jgi:phage-related protein
MPTQTFTYKPAAGAAYSCKPTVLPIKFGDGYETRVPLGLNNKPKKWTLKFASNVAVAALAFMDARGGSEAFYWTDPMGVLGLYVCREWNADYVGPGAFELSAAFEQVFSEV